MNIIKTQKGSELYVALEGRLDAITSRQLEAALRTSIEGITILDFDLAKLEYISSGGIRVLMSAWKVMKRQGKMNVRNVQPVVLDILEFTGIAETFQISTDSKSTSEPDHE